MEITKEPLENTLNETIVTKQALLDLIQKIGGDVDDMLITIKNQKEEIVKLKQENQNLQEDNQSTLSQIKEYIQELEKIRSHYVNSNDTSRE
ncbi:MAG: hypothetical protein HRU35_01210 [Rickettsiaceae bacterium]|nr:hypothetical protein [Rickettsiaceae bacterium]